MIDSPPGTALITGGSAGLGADYARQLDRRGHDIILVAVDKAGLDEAARAISASTGRDVSVITADLATTGGIEAVERRLREDPAIDTVVNNAGIGMFGRLSAVDPGQLDRLLDVNVRAVTRIAAAAASAFVRRRNGTIINISSTLAVYLMPVSAAYSATKGYVLTLSQALAEEFAGTPLRVQAVVPGVMRTAWWEGSGLERSQFPESIIMAPEDVAAAGLAGLDQGEIVTIPALPDYADWRAFDHARQTVGVRAVQPIPAARYLRPGPEGRSYQMTSQRVSPR